MTKCIDCKHAVWKRTAAGHLHPSGDGKCTYPWKMPPLPACMHWIGRSAPIPHGGPIDRRTEHRADCVYYEQGKA